MTTPESDIEAIRRALRRAFRTPPEFIIFNYFGQMKDARSSACTLAMYQVDGYLAAARRQIKRIQNFRARSRREIDHIRRSGGRVLRRRLPSTSELFAEAHFYFICWRMIGEMLEAVRSRCQLRPLNQFMSQHKTKFAAYDTVRNHLEHFRERLPGGARVHELQVPNDLGNFSTAKGGFTFRLNAQRWDISRRSLDDLSAIVKGFKATLLNAAREGRVIGGRRPAAQSSSTQERLEVQNLTVLPE